MVRPNEPVMPPKCTTKVRLGIYYSQIRTVTLLYLKVSMILWDIRLVTVILQDIRTADLASDWLIANLGTW